MTPTKPTYRGMSAFQGMPKPAPTYGHSMFTVVANVPGYLPEDEPAVFNDREDAEAYAAEIADEWRENGLVVTNAGHGTYYAEDPTKIHDLGFVVEVLTLPDTMQCESCGDIIENVSQSDAQWTNLTQRLVCYGCYESMLAHATNIVALHDEDERIVWADEFAFDQYGNDVDPREDFGLVQGWHSTDAWRGYTDVRIDADADAGWTIITAGSLLFGETTRAQRVGERLQTEGIEAYAVIAPTSNVLARTIDILVRDEDAERIEALIDEWELS